MRTWAPFHSEVFECGSVDVCVCMFWCLVGIDLNLMRTWVLFHLEYSFVWVGEWLYVWVSAWVGERTNPRKALRGVQSLCVAMFSPYKLVQRTNINPKQHQTLSTHTHTHIHT